MNTKVMCWVLVTMMGCTSLVGRTRQTGHLTVRVTDRFGDPITNAVVTVRNLLGSGWNAGICESQYTKTRAQTDTNGVADVCFQFLTGDFSWSVRTPSHYSGDFEGSNECFSAQIVQSDYLYFNTNTVDGLAKYNELKDLEDAGDYVGYAAKFEPKSVTFLTNAIYREATGFYPKRNPQPMFAFGEYSLDYDMLPTHFETINSNGVELLKYDETDFDLQLGAFLPPWGGRLDHTAGKVSDFKIVRYSVTTNDVTEYFGRIEFAPGCGAYKRKKTGNASFPSTYEADTNAVYLSNIPYRYYRRNGAEKSVSVEKLLGEDEYMVLRTRVLRDEDTGVITNCHYSKIFGEMSLGKLIYFEGSVFNHRPNDPNLEYDILAPRLEGSERCRWP